MASVYFIAEKYIYILALEVASPGIQHCASSIGTLSFHMMTRHWRTTVQNMILQICKQGHWRTQMQGGT